MKELLLLGTSNKQTLDSKNSWINPVFPGYDISVHIGPVGNNHQNCFDVVYAAGTMWIIIGGSKNCHVPQGYVMSMVRTSIHSCIAKHHSMMSMGLPAMIEMVIKNSLQMWNNADRTNIAIAALDDSDFYFSNLNSKFFIYRQSSKSVELLDRNDIWKNSGSTRDRISMQDGDIMILFSADSNKKNLKEFKPHSFNCLEKVLKSKNKTETEDIKKSILFEMKEHCSIDEVTLVVARKKDLPEETTRH